MQWKGTTASRGDGFRNHADNRKQAAVKPVEGRNRYHALYCN